MKPIGDQFGIDLGVLDGKAHAAEPTPRCPGARVRVTRKDVHAMTQGGERFLDEGTRVPFEGYGDARAYCNNLVEVGRPGVSGARVVYGLCASCTRLENTNRATLRERHGSRDR